MKNILIILSLAAFVSCNSSKDEKKDKVNGDTSGVKTDTTTVKSSTGKIDIESFGPIKIGQHYLDAKNTLGSPGERGVPVLWEADGSMHEDWNYPTKGLVVSLAFETGKPEGKSIFSITGTAPGDFKTSAGMGIGNTYAEVEAAYKKDIDAEMTNSQQIVVGSIYGGIIFSFSEGKVARVFLGAAAE